MVQLNNLAELLPFRTKKNLAPSEIESCGAAQATSETTRSDAVLLTHNQPDRTVPSR